MRTLESTEANRRTQTDIDVTEAWKLTNMLKPLLICRNCWICVGHQYLKNFTLSPLWPHAAFPSFLFFMQYIFCQHSLVFVEQYRTAMEKVMMNFLVVNETVLFHNTCKKHKKIYLWDTLRKVLKNYRTKWPQTHHTEEHSIYRKIRFNLT